MSIIGNIFWIVLGGWIIFLLYLAGGVALCVTIVGVPFGFQCFKLSILGLVPFGKKITPGPSVTGTVAVILNIIWIVTFGLTIALTHLILAVLLGITLIGLPFARQHVKLAGFALTPFGYRLSK